MKKPASKITPRHYSPGAVSSAPRCNCSSAVTCRFGSCSMPNASSKKKLPYMDAMDVGKYQFIRFHKQFGGGSNNQRCKVHVKTGDIASFYIQVWVMFHWKNIPRIDFSWLENRRCSFFGPGEEGKKRTRLDFPRTSWGLINLKMFELNNPNGTSLTPSWELTSFLTVWHFGWWFFRTSPGRIS